MAEVIDWSDQVFHLAAAVGVKLIVESPVRTIETNIRLTEIVLEMAAKKKRPTFIASTSEASTARLQRPAVPRGRRPRHGRRTEQGPLVLCLQQGAIDEFLAIAYWKEKKHPDGWSRGSSTPLRARARSPGQYGMVIPNFVRQALTGQPITVYGDGKQSRCFTHVNDVVRAFIGLMEQPGGYGQVFNIGNPVEISIGDLAKQIREMVGSKSEIVLIPYEKAYEEGFEDMPRRVPNIGKISKHLNWKPTIGLQQILTDVIEYQRNLT